MALSSCAGVGGTDCDVGLCVGEAEDAREDKVRVGDAEACEAGVVERRGDVETTA